MRLALLLALLLPASALAAGARDVELGPVSSFPYFNKVAFFIQGPMSAQDLKTLKTQVIPQARELLTQGGTPNWLRFKTPRRVRGVSVPKYWDSNGQLSSDTLPIVMDLAKRDPDARTLPVLITNGVTLGTRKRRDLGFSLDAESRRVMRIAEEAGLLLPRRGFVALANDDPHEKDGRLIDEPGVAATTLAHEIGHALGLKHPKAKDNLMSVASPGLRLNRAQKARIKRWIKARAR